MKGSSNIEKRQKRIWDCKDNVSGRGYALKEDHANPIFDRKETQKQQLLLQTLSSTFSCLLVKTHLESRNYNCLPSKPGIENRQKKLSAKTRLRDFTSDFQDILGRKKNIRSLGINPAPVGCLLKWWYPTTMGKSY